MMDDTDDMSEEKMVEHDKMMEEDSMMWNDEMMDDQTTGYLDYSTDLLGKNETTVLFFHATWCPSCNTAEKNISSTWVEDFLLLKVDYDSNVALRQEYGVTSQHTFVQVDSEGTLIKKWSGWSSVADITAKIQ